MCRPMYTRRLGMLCLVVMFLSPLCLAHDVAVVAGRDSSASAINSADLQKLLKADSPRWPDGKKVTIFLSDPSSPYSRLLLGKLFKVEPEKLESFLRAHKDSFTVLDSEDLVLRAVAGHPGSLGVVNVYSINSAIKVLKVDGKLPLEQGYLLHANN